MKSYWMYAIIFVAFVSCTRQPSLPGNSTFNVTAVLNDSVWFGSGKALRIKEAGKNIENVRKFNLIVLTDIDYPGMGGGPNPNTSNGCLDPECTRTQSLVVYNVPLKKGRFNIAKLNQHSTRKNEFASLSYIGNAGGLLNHYVYKGLKPGWIRVTKFDKKLGIVEGRFVISFSQDTESDLPLRNRMSAAARFTDGLFRIKITDISIK
ncbi:hypothetical protein MUK70_00575 [Dyadobacter chenwenxiniae]|uniref:Uncharacterized protein n=1 Tax=Dyadobacter chenwenxiniae TaxID=2906456 RepID=A0A9X1TF32_9BACT|nr:hypothetical protein [Dyadobacter chenwenxiniae]MCF0063821.1 hypothetical protein [Dyadobacter chenwenxiniae]UON83497.1 hypothetical protein MUK70_00575 [Dyadobacter chenwenxiniae]